MQMTRLTVAAMMLGGMATVIFAETRPFATIAPPPTGSVSQGQGLLAFDRIYEVVSHPRCANCHVGPDNVPMWFGGADGPARPHGMNINAGQSRIGVETIVCSTCHRTRPDDLTLSPETTPHLPPSAGLDWQLAPVDFEWFGNSKSEICAQLSDPDRNGGRDWMGLAEHLVDDAGHIGFVLWGWNPGGNREPAPYSLQAHLDDVLAWGVAGQPCPVN
jgi:hypothetical protein